MVTLFSLMVTNKERRLAFLVESCLLTFGLASIGDDDLAREWKAAGVEDARICWMERGEIVVGALEDFLHFRSGAPRYKFASDSLERAIAEKLSGALTASATMEACRRFSVPYAVSCGIGGIGDVKGEEVCADLSMIRDSGVVLICTSPKDMLDIEATVGWLLREGVRVLGDGGDVCTGYVFNGRPVRLSGSWRGGDLRPPLLLLRGIAADKRMQDEEILKRAVCEAKEAERRGGYFHPAANAALDRLTGGYSSRLQLSSLLDNIRFAAKLELNL